MPRRSQRRSKVEQVVAELTEPTGSDVTLGIASAGLSVVPVVGGPISALVDEMRRMHDTRIAEMVADLRVSFDGLGRRLDRRYVRTVKFKERLLGTLEEATRESQFEKKAHYVRALTRAASVDRPDDVMLRLYVDVLDRVRPIHLQLLAALMELPDDLPVHQYFAEGSAERERIVSAMPGIPLGLIQRLWDDLATYGLTDSLSVLTTEGFGDPNSPGPITRFGRDFLKFLTADDATDDAIVLASRGGKPRSRK